ncbi:hypothetical protein D3C73_1233860 [compost metagenome]
MDVHAQRIGVGQFFAPDTGFQFLPGDHGRGRFHQRLQDLQRGRVELQQLALAAHFQRVQVVFQITGFQHAGLHALAATRQGVQTHFHFLQRERLDQVVVSTGIEAGQFVVQRIARGQHQHRGLLACFVAKLAADLDTVHARQVEIQDNRVELVHDSQMQPGHSVGSEVHGVAPVLQVVAQIGRNVAVVFDYQDSHCHL